MTYDELKHYWTKAIRSGRIRLLSKIERAFYKACISFAKLKGRILNEKLTSKACKAREVYGLEISEKGVEMARKNGVL